MSLSLASNPWSASANPSRDGALGGIEVAADAGERRWVLKRNCAVTPAQMGLFYLSLCVVSLGIGTFFALNGAAFVLGFAGLEVVVVGVALLYHARHCADREVLRLAGGRLEVECTSAGDVRHESFDATFVRVESVPGSLVRVSGQGRSLLLGRHLRPHLRETLVGELRRALRDAVAVREAGTDE
jgi:uncharacterized membrane protein